MSRTAFATSSASAVSGLKSATSRTNKQSFSLAKGHGSDTDLSAASATKSSVPSKVLPTSRAQSKKQFAGTADYTRPASRIELLLAPKAPSETYQPQEQSAIYARTNKAIKFAAQWVDIRAAVSETTDLSASNIAFATYRLGCLYSFTSQYRKKEIQNSGFIDVLLNHATQKLHQLDAGSVTLLLDGCARLEHRPPDKLLSALANLVHSFAFLFEASQLPLVLWAFDRLNFVPRRSTLGVLDSAVDKIAPTISPQGIALILRSFQAASHTPSPRTLHRLVEVMYRHLSQYKPSEIAASLDAFAAFGYKPPNQLIMAIAQQCGQSVHSNIVTGKPALSRQASAQSEVSNSGLAEQPPTFVDQGSRVAASQISAAQRMLRQVSQKIGELDASLGVPSQGVPPVFRHM